MAARVRPGVPSTATSWGCVSPISGPSPFGLPDGNKLGWGVGRRQHLGEASGASAVATVTTSPLSRARRPTRLKRSSLNAFLGVTAPPAAMATSKAHGCGTIIQQACGLNQHTQAPLNIHFAKGSDDGDGISGGDQDAKQRRADPAPAD